MKLLALLMAMVLGLSGCADGDPEVQQGMQLRAKLLKAERVSFDAEITADYGEKIQAFSVSCRSDKEGNVFFSVTAPETIADITGRIDEDGGALTFDDKALYFELLTDDQLSPVSAPWILMKTLRSGCLTSACREEDGLRLTIDDSYEDDALTVDIWLDQQNLPHRADILYDGRRILTLNVKNVVIA